MLLKQCGDFYPPEADYRPAFYESQNGHHERVKGLFVKTSKLNTTNPTDMINTKNTTDEIS